MTNDQNLAVIMIIQNIFRKCCPVCINGEYKHSKLLIEYHLIDNDIKIDLGHLLFVKHFSNDWFIGDELFIDKGKGIIDKIYNKWFNFGGSCYQAKSVKELKKNISSNTNGILDSILKNIKRNVLTGMSKITLRSSNKDNKKITISR